MSGIIPIEPGVSEQRIEIALDDVPYVLRVRWSSRLEVWFLDVYEQDGTSPIALGLALVLGVLIGEHVLHVLFDGALFLRDDSGTGLDAGLGDLGARVTLWYLTPQDRALSETPDIGAA